MSKKFLNAIAPGLIYGLAWAASPGVMLILHGMGAIALAGASLALVLRRLTRKRLAC